MANCLIVAADHPGLHYWQPGSPLPEFRFTDHVAKPHVRAAQRIAHACLLPALDRLRPRYPDGAYPQRIPTDVAQRISLQLSRHVAAQSSAALPA
jgi:hypothetical protein